MVLSISIKKIIIEPKWNEISLATCDTIAYFYSDSITYYQKLSQNNPFLTLPYDTRALVNCEQNRIEYNKDKVYYQYDLNGKLILQLSDGQRQRMTNADHKYVVKGDQKKYVLQDKNGATVLPVPDAPIKPTTTTTPPKKEASGNLNQAVIPEGPPSPPAPPVPIRSDSPYRDSKIITGKSYKEILAIKNNAKNESVYICAFAEKEHPSTVTYNDRLQVITPKGYSVPTYLKENNQKNPGTLFVINDISATKDKYRYTSGICDYEGKWVVPPFTGYLKLVEEGLFIVEDHDKKAVITYDQKGNRTNDVEFFSIDGDNYTNFFQNRILVSINQDPTYFKRAEMIFKNEDDLTDINVAIKKIEELGEPKLVYGFIDKKGKLVLDLKYIKAKPFPKNSTKTIVAIERNGNIISQIIDTSGHVYLEFEYEDIAELDSTHYMAKKDSLWGITGKNGKALTTFQYTKIYKDKKKPFFQAHKEKKRYLIDSTYTEHYLGEWYSVNTEYLNAHYIVHISTEYGKESDFKDRFIIYNKNFKEVVRFDNIKSIEDNYNGVAIPPNLLYIKKDIDAKNDFFYDLAKGRKLMKE
ncbi:MAG TPA: WG repeat-containing protein [Saprospiraceae bacterium]|nr:WG repeat-containing protein [Saprospiraceae bacterium]